MLGGYCMFWQVLKQLANSGLRITKHPSNYARHPRVVSVVSGGIWAAIAFTHITETIECHGRNTFAP